MLETLIGLKIAVSVLLQKQKVHCGMIIAAVRQIITNIFSLIAKLLLGSDIVIGFSN